MRDRRDRRLLVALGVVLAALVLISTSDDSARRGDPRVSTFLDTPRGARALFLTLRDLDIPVDRRLHGLEGLEPEDGALAMLSPRDPPSPAERDSLIAWVEGGGTLLYAAVARRDPVLDRLGLRSRALVPDSVSPLDRAGWPGVSAWPGPHAWTAGIDSVSGVTRAFADPSRAIASGDATPLLVTAEGDPVALTLRRGTGRVIAWSDPGPLTNEGLRRSGAALIVARAAAAATVDGDSLVFDEYHNGYRMGGGPVRATLRFLADAPTGHAALQLAAAVIGLLLLMGRRFGSPVPRPPRPRRSPLEHVDALGGAYRQAGARDTARRLLVAGLARRLRAAGPARTSGAADREAKLLEHLAGSLPAGRRHARALLNEWNRDEGADLAAMAREVDRLLAEVKKS